jgi:hypothetical protein
VTELIDSIRAEYLRYKALGEGAIRQVRDDELSTAGPAAGNSLAIICWHLSGNLRSRFTDFLTADGEKPWRNREEEFDDRVVSRDEFMEKWDAGWAALLAALGQLTDDHLRGTVTIRQQPLKVHEALYRSLAHTAYHVGQMVYVAKAFRGEEWSSLSIPRGRSQAYNQDARFERAGAHADALEKRDERG